MNTPPSSTLWGRVLSAGTQLPPSRVVLAQGRIKAVEPAPRPLPDDVVVDAGWIAPGLIDLQVNGAGGVDLTSAADPCRALEDVARTLAAHGTTAFCPTLVSSSLDVILRGLDAYGPRAIAGGASSLGIHVEGPFIDPAHRGVHDPTVLRDASVAEVERWLAVARPTIVTLAPDRPGALDVIRRLVEAGVLVSLGHSGADTLQAQAGLAAGARMATHLFNAMPPLHHRAPGLVGVLLGSDAALGLIADGVHLDRLIVDLVVRRAGARRVVLVSDSLAAAGEPPGASRLGEQEVISDGRVVRRSDGTLAGSALLLDGCLQNLRAWFADLPPATLVAMATSTPADLLGARRKGRIEVGCDADLVILSEDFHVRATFVGGDSVSA